MKDSASYFQEWYAHLLRCKEIDQAITLARHTMKAFPEVSDLAYLKLCQLSQEFLNEYIRPIDCDNLPDTILIDRFSRYSSEYNVIANVFKESHLISHSDFENYDNLEVDLQNAIELGKGFSFIRIGDGEAALLASALPREIGIDIKSDLLLGDVFFNWSGIQLHEQEDSYFSRLRLVAISLYESLESADCLGGISIEQAESIFYKCKYSEELTNYSAYLSSLASSIIISMFKPNHVYEASNGHVNFSPERITRICMFSRAVGVISPFKVLPSCISNVRHHIVVSPRSKDAKCILGNEHANTPWGRENPLLELTSALDDIDVTGTTWILAGGILAKSLSKYIKMRGGVSIDVGSAMDYLSNFESRS